jgi:plastocyanin
MNQLVVRGCVLAATALLVAGCGSDAAPTDAGAAKGEVKIASFRFVPQTVTVRKGGTVTFTNFDIAPHTATADDQSFDTDRLESRRSATETFNTAGTYTYYCVYHRFMVGTVVVK